MNEYVKSLTLDLSVRFKDAKKVQGELDELKKSLDVDLSKTLKTNQFKRDLKKSFGEGFREAWGIEKGEGTKKKEGLEADLQDKQAAIEALEAELANASDDLKKGLAASLEALKKEVADTESELENLDVGLMNSQDAAKKFREVAGKKLAEGIQQAMTTITKSIKSFVEDIFEQAEELAAYSGESMTYSSDVTALKEYGLEGKEAYAMAKALEDAGFSSIEDYLENMYYADQTTLDYMEQQRQMYLETYDQAVEEAADLAEVKTKFENIKTLLTNDFMVMIAENSDEIMEFARTVMDDLSEILKYFSGSAANKAGESAAEAAVASDIANYATSNANTINANSTFNITSPNSIEAADKVNKALGNVINSANKAMSY